MWNVTPKREMKDMCGGASAGGGCRLLVARLVFCYELGYNTQLSVNNVKLASLAQSQLFISKSNIIPVVYSAAASNSNNFTRTSTSTTTSTYPSQYDPLCGRGP